MADRISQEDANLWSDVLLDEEERNTLTPGQIRTMQGKLTQFIEEQESRHADMIDEGHTPEEATKLVQRENDAISDGSYQVGGTLKKISGVPGQGQVFGAARLLNSGAEGAWQVVEGAGDLVNEVAVGLNLQSREDADRYKQTVRQMRFERKMSDIDMFGRFNNKAGEFVGQVVPWLATGAVGGGQSLLRYGLSQGLVGATASTAVVSEEAIEDRWQEALVGGGAGTAFTAAFGAPAAVRRWAARRFMSELNLETSANNVELEKAVQEMLNNESFGFSLAQVTGNRFVHALEGKSASHAQKDAQNNNIQMLFDHILKQSDDLSRAGVSTDDVVWQLRATLDKANKSIHKRASATFESNLNKIEAEYGDDIILDYDGGLAYLDQLDKHLLELSDPLRPGVSASNSFKAYRGEIDELVNPVTFKRRTVQGADGKNRIVYDLLNRRTGEVDAVGLASRGEAMTQSMIRNESLGGLQAGEINRVTQGLNDMLAGRTAVVEGSGDVAQDKSISKGLMGVLTRNLSANNKNQGAVDALATMRESYKGEMLILGDIERLVVARQFGQAEMPADPDMALDVVMGAGETSLRNTRKFLEEWEPALLGDLQSAYLRRIASVARDNALPGVDVPINLTKMANAIGGREGVGMKGLGLFDEATQIDLKKTGEALRTIKNLYFTGVTPTGSFTLDDLAINVISQSPEFMARFVTRVLSGGERMSNALLDPMLRKSIQTLAEQNLNTASTTAGRAAMYSLVTFMNQMDVADEQAQKEAAEQGGNTSGRQMQ